MNLKKSLLGILAAAVIAAGAAPQAGAEVKREHRAVWLSSFLGEWPSSAVTSSTIANRQIANLETALDRMKENNFTTVYFHVRSFCDATYVSSYEPWSSTVSGTRGGDAPYFDPLQVIIEKCHERGIELYAWVNPYRYCGSSNYYNLNNALDYEVSHPDWLLVYSGNETILNPALPEVQQRIVDVCHEIITNYDVDGLVFDDYFYTSGTPLTLDADLFAASGATNQYQWRRDNVNSMVKKVGEMVFATKPYLNFGISPAGSCNPSNLSDYGLEDSGMSDWQYNGIASDPIYWVAHHYIDFVSPQIYSSTNAGFLKNSSWWVDAGQKLGRFVHVSTTLSLTTSSKGGYKADEYVQQQLHVRDEQLLDQSGLCYFSYGTFNTYREKDPDTGVNSTLPALLAKSVYQNKALSPLRYWRNNYSPVMTANVVKNDSKLTWDPVEGMRYTVYAVPSTLTDAEFACQPQYLKAICYSAQYTIPDELNNDATRWAVCVYDRYGNEYAPLFQGAQAGTCAAPTLTYPAAGGELTPMADLTWESDGTKFLIELADDEEAMEISNSTLLATFETDAKHFSSAQLPALTPGQTYLWRVTACGPNKLNATSKTQRFVADKIKVTSPTETTSDVSRTPTISWTAAAPGVTYKLEIATSEKFTTLRYEGTTQQTSLQVPDYVLSTGVTYYARVTATLGDNSAQSDVSSFTVAPVDYTDAPVFVNPAASGQTIHSNESVTLAPYGGLSAIIVEISKTDAFPTRTGTYRVTLNNFETSTKELGEVLISSSHLEDGTTYYLRARGNYLKSNSNYYTPYTDVMTFVYSSAAGIDAIGTDADARTVIGYYDLQGRPVDTTIAGSLYIARYSDGTAAKVIAK